MAARTIISARRSALIFAFDEPILIPAQQNPACELSQAGFFLRFVNALQFSTAFSGQPAFQHSQETDKRIPALAGRTVTKRNRRIPVMGVVTGSQFAI